MTTKTRPVRKALLAAAAGLALVLSGTACSGDVAESEGVRDVPAEETAARTEGAKTADASTANLATAKFDVEGMTCGGCALATEMSVKKLDGVSSADASYDESTGEGRCTVEYDPSTVGTEQIASAIEKAGFTPTLTSESFERSTTSVDGDGRP
jgi:copper chaperone CopZ